MQIADTDCGDFISILWSEILFEPTEIFDVGSCVINAERELQDGSLQEFSATVNVAPGDGAGMEGTYATLVLRLQTQLIVNDVT